MIEYRKSTFGKRVYGSVRKKNAAWEEKRNGAQRKEVKMSEIVQRRASEFA